MIEENQVYSLDYLGFAAGVRLHWSEIRQQHWLLFPEGAIALNPTAVAVLRKCDGHSSFEAITTALEQQFCDVKESDIQHLLFYMMKRGLLVSKVKS